MRRLGLLVSTVLVMGCNSILDIPERSLLVEEDATAGDTAFVIDTATLPDTNVLVEDSSMPAETGIDASSEDSTSVDSTTTDSTTADDSMLADSAMTDSAMTDSAMTDTAMVDSAMVDSATTDMGADAPTCGVAGSPCCGAVAATCNTGAACSGGVCSAAAGACVRATDCASGTVCGGPTLCAGKLCFSCGAAPGSGALGSACTDKSQCASGVCDRSRAVCTVPCANGITGDADCTTITNGTCVVANWTISGSGGSVVSGKVGFCARGCSRDAACNASEYCRVFGNDVADRVDFVCAPARTGATVDPLGACMTDAECKGGFCLGTVSGGRCTAACVSDMDCGTALPKCNNVNFTRPVSMTTQVAKFCTPG